MGTRAENWGALQDKANTVSFSLWGATACGLSDGSSRQTCTPYFEFYPSQLWLPCGPVPPYLLSLLRLTV